MLFSALFTGLQRGVHLLQGAAEVGSYRGGCNNEKEKRRQKTALWLRHPVGPVRPAGSVSAGPAGQGRRSGKR